MARALRALLVSAVTVTLASWASVEAYASPASGAGAFHLAGEVHGVTVTAESDYSDGTALVSYLKDGVPFDASGPVGSTITFTTKAGRPTMSLTTPSGLNADGSKSRPRGIGQSTVEFLKRQNATPANIAPNIANGTILATPCITPSGNGGRFCDVITVVKDNGGGDWYVGDQLTGTASAQLLFWGNIDRGTGNSVIQWNPTSTIIPNVCKPYTFSAGVSGGSSVSTTGTLCPDSVDPTLGSDGRSYGLVWHHSFVCCGYYSAGLAGVDIFHSPPAAAWGVSMTSLSS